jgi:hypothetical protein
VGFTVKLEAVGFSGTLVRNYQVIWCHIPWYHTIDISVVIARYAEIKSSWNFHFIWFQVVKIGKEVLGVAFSFVFV